MPHGADLGAFREVIGGALALLEEHRAVLGKTGTALLPARHVNTNTIPSVPLSDLLEQCQTLVAHAVVQPLPPLRLVHHMACTGGTLIARCIGALPNTRVLSEVDPLSELAHLAPRFFPCDLIGLAKFGTRPPDRDVLIEIFLAGLMALHENSRRQGLDLVLRDHAHSHFCHGLEPGDRPTLREILVRSYPLRAVVTLRHPLDSFLALQAHGWLHFAPSTPEEYARRYHAFLDRHADLPWLQYEEFLNDPETMMQQICTTLDLVYDPSFRQLFTAVQLSGDSGRSGPILAKRPRRDCPDELLNDIEACPVFGRLLTRTGYRLDS